MAKKPAKAVEKPLYIICPECYEHVIVDRVYSDKPEHQCVICELKKLREKANENA